MTLPLFRMSRIKSWFFTRGRIVEGCDGVRFFEAPRHPYSRALLKSLPSIEEKRKLSPIAGHAPPVNARNSGCVYKERCDFSQPACGVEPLLTEQKQDTGHLARCHFPQTASMQTQPILLAPKERLAARDEPLLTIQGLSAFYGNLQVLKDINLEVQGGQCLAIVGESGSGKSTLSRCLVGLHHNWGGQIRLSGTSVAPSSSRRDSDQRRRIQYVFQNPYGSLNPRQTVGASIAVAVEHFSGGRREQVNARVRAALERVSLPSHYANRYPNELSGGEKQRVVAIARGLVCSPDILVCDEVTSALDVSVQAAIVELLRSLMDDGLGIVFVTHNLAVVRSLSDRVAVLDAGLIVEAGETGTVMDCPTAAYTKHLMAHTLEMKP
ncbi:ATP-binding cassette domain-containing protein (plasmid) [Rhizobium sp. RCAM05350]|nr:ATP-binding cassette domain-containing protein [Rhizobium sp. RCAM05350]